MKKLIIAGSVLMFIGFFGLVPVARADTFGDLQNLINKLRDQVSAFRQVAATGGGLQNSGSGGFVPPVGYCPAGTVGAGKVNETLRCNGSKWVASNMILNRDNHVGIGTKDWNTEAQETLLVHDITISGGTGVYGVSNKERGVGVRGFGRIGVIGQASPILDGSIGVQGSASANNSKSVVARQDVTGYGFYQEGGQAKNYFEGKLGFGTANNPQESVDLGGGNIKMGYEMVTTSANNSQSVRATCPSEKQVIGGGCGFNGNSELKLWTSSPGMDGSGYFWQCSYSGVANQVSATAICANIR